MSEQQRQHLSALVDDELDSTLVDPTVSALESSIGLKTAWERYHLIGAAMRSEGMREEYRQISALVSERVASEPVPLMSPTTRRSRASRFAPLAGAALAAAAAFFAVFAVPKLFSTRPNAPDPSSLQVASFLPEQFQLPGQTLRWHVDKPSLESKLDRFLVNHQAQSPASGMKGFLPYATVVGYAAER